MTATSLLSFESGCPDRPPLFLFIWAKGELRASTRAAANIETKLTFDLTEKRYIKETGLETRIARIVEPVANDLGYSLVRVKVTQENGCTLQIMAEDEQWPLRHHRLRAAEQGRVAGARRRGPDRPRISPRGVARPASTGRWSGPATTRRYVGHEAKVELADVLNGRKRFRGLITAADRRQLDHHHARRAQGRPIRTMLPLACSPRPSW